MGRNHELRIRELVFEQFAELAAVTDIDGHHDVIHQRKYETIPQQALHQCEIQTDAHTVLMPLAVKGTRRVHAAVVEVDIKVEFAASG